MSFTVIIPARHASSRLPGKPLLDLAGQPMLPHVWQRAHRSGAARVVIATDDARIRDAAQAWGAEVRMTRADHPSGTDRLQEAACALGLGPTEIVVNVQGDEPLIPPAVIDQVAALLASAPAAAMATLCEPLLEAAEVLNPNIVKVVADGQGRALYFSRAPIPWPRDAPLDPAQAQLPPGTWWRHIGLYAYRVAFLDRFVAAAPAPLERVEQLEQLRALHCGEQIQVAAACAPVPGGVDTPADLARLRTYLEGRGE